MARVALDSDTLAKKAVARIRGSAEYQQRRASFPTDDLAMVKVYVTDAYNYLRERSQGLDPMIHAPTVAADCMVQAAVDKWFGRDAFTTERGALLLTTWLKTGRVAKHRLAYAQ